jgi:type III secretion protein W
MSDRIDAFGNAALRYGKDEAEATEGGAATGIWSGEGVRLEPPDALSLLEDAKEELTFMHEERMESKSIEERNLRSEDEGPSERVERIRQVMEQLPDLDSHELDVFRAALQASKCDAAEVLRQMRERFSDPSHGHAALQYAEQEFRGGGELELADRVAEARAQFEAEEGPAIRAGLNVSKAAFEVAEGDRAAAAELRDSYRAAVFGKPGPSGIYKGIIDRVGIEGFPAQVKFLTRALGDDLGAAGPSVERPQLRELLENLYALRTLDTVHERCGELAGRVKRLCGTELAPTTVMQRLLPLTEETVSGPSKIKGIPEQVGVPARRLDAQILFLREAQGIMAMMPPAVYRDLDARFSVLGGIQEAMDLVIEREEGEG